MNFGIAGVAAITVIAWLIGEIVKNTGLDNKWIPVICGLSGAILGILGMDMMPDFPAQDYITAIWTELRLWVPSSSMASISDWVPGVSSRSALVPASKLRLTIALGTALRRASVTGMPFDSVVRSIAGKARSPTGKMSG